MCSRELAELLEYCSCACFWSARCCTRCTCLPLCAAYFYKVLLCSCVIHCLIRAAVLTLHELAWCIIQKVSGFREAPARASVFCSCLLFLHSANPHVSCGRMSAWSHVCDPTSAAILDWADFHRTGLKFHPKSTAMRSRVRDPPQRPYRIGLVFMQQTGNFDSVTSRVDTFLFLVEDQRYLIFLDWVVYTDFILLNRLSFWNLCVPICDAHTSTASVNSCGT